MCPVPSFLIAAAKLREPRGVSPSFFLEPFRPVAQSAACIGTLTWRPLNGKKEFHSKAFPSEGPVACKACGSENQKGFSAEIAFVLAGRGILESAPVYMVEKPVVCLECGFTELVVPNPKLQFLKGHGDAETCRLRSPVDSSLPSER